MSGRKLLGADLPLDERIALAQLTAQPGWKILVRLMGEACRQATKDVINLKPTVERYPEVLAGLQTLAHAMNRFSGDVLDSVKVLSRSALDGATTAEKEQAGMTEEQSLPGRFQGFKFPKPKHAQPQSLSEGSTTIKE